jgi:TPP-dependent indolepyruvate ferredoxin oxidoreductase alpha subunit
LEKEVYAIAKDINPSLAIFGKGAGIFSEAWEYNPNIVAKGMASAMGMEYADYEPIIQEAKKERKE